MWLPGKAKNDLAFPVLGTVLFPRQRVLRNHGQGNIYFCSESRSQYNTNSPWQQQTTHLTWETGFARKSTCPACAAQPPRWRWKGMAILHHKIRFTPVESRIHILKRHRVPYKFDISNLPDRASQIHDAPGKPTRHNMSQSA